MCCHKFTPKTDELKKLEKQGFVDEILQSQENCFGYTGVPTIAALYAIYKWLEPMAQSVKLWDGKKKLRPGRQKGRWRKSLSLFEEYLLTLVRIQHDFYNDHLSFLFLVSQEHISRILITWINLLYIYLSELVDC